MASALNSENVTGLDGMSVMVVGALIPKML